MNIEIKVLETLKVKQGERVKLLLKYAGGFGKGEEK